MILEEEKLKQEEKEKEEKKEMFRKRVDLGRSAERLSANQDWKRISETINARFAIYESDKNYHYDAIVNGCKTSEDKISAVEAIRMINSTTEFLRVFLDTPERLAKEGQEAEKELSKLDSGGQ